MTERYKKYAPSQKGEGEGNPFFQAPTPDLLPIYVFFHFI